MTDILSLFPRLRQELSYIDDVATLGIKAELDEPSPNHEKIIKELKESIQDGYKGLSINLSNDILKAH